VLITGFEQPLQINDLITLYMLPFIPLHFLCTHLWQLVYCIELLATPLSHTPHRPHGHHAAFCNGFWRSPLIITLILLWLPYGTGQAIIFLPYGFFLSFSPFPQIDIIGAVVIVWRVRGKTIRSVLCNIVCNNCAQCNAHTYEQTNSSLDWVLSHWAHFTVLRLIFVLCITVCCIHA